MENKSMTAIEWLEQEFIALQNYGVNELGLFEKAKKMEKQQIIDACNQIEVIGLDYDLPGEQYYNETFNK
jgi:hypothetical protein